MKLDNECCKTYIDISIPKSKSYEVEEKLRNQLSTEDTYPLGRLSSASSRSLSNCCQYVSVVVTNEQTAMNSENNTTCHTNVSKEFTIEHMHGIPRPEDVLKITNNVDDSIELTNLDSRIADEPSDDLNMSGSDDIWPSPNVITKPNENCVCDLKKPVVDIVSKIPNYNLSAVNDKMAFTDESCNQYIDSDEPVIIEK